MIGSNKFRITLKGDEADDSLRLSALIEQLNAVKVALNQVNISVSGDKAPEVYYRVTKITMNSPAVFELEAVSKKKSRAYERRLVTKFSRDLAAVVEGRRPKSADLQLLEAYGSLSQPMRRHVTEVSLQFANSTLMLPRNLDTKIDDILGPDQIEQGSVVGSLDVIDVHNDRNLFKIYPAVGPKSIKCRFPRGQLAAAVDAIKHFVRIHGELVFKKGEKFPHLIKVSRIEKLPEKSDGKSLLSLRGIATGALGGKSSTEYIDMVRNGDW
jgi:hypothetical protein